MDEDDVRVNLSFLELFIRDVQIKNYADYGCMDCYIKVYNLVFLHKHGAQVYEVLRKSICNHLNQKVLLDAIVSRDEDFLRTLNKNWKNHIDSMELISKVFTPVDQYFVKKNNLASVYEFGMIIFRDEVIYNVHVRFYLQRLLFSMITRDRHGELVDRIAIKNVCSMLKSLNSTSRPVYEEIFEKPFLMHSEDFYMVESLNFLKINNIPTYIAKVEQWMTEEQERARSCLNESTEHLIVQVLEDELINKHMKIILEMENSGVIHMLKNQSNEDLACVYNLFSRVPDGPQTMAKYVSDYLRVQGKSVVTEEEEGKGDALNFVKNLLDLQTVFYHYLCHAFKNDSYFKHMIATDFEYILNINLKTPEYLCIFIDNKFKKEVRGMKGLDIHRFLNEIIRLLRYVKDKDEFETYYRILLSQRLLNSDLCSYSEKHMISKLRKDYGCQFTSKMERMLNDISVSNSMMKDFKAHAIDSGTNLYHVDLNVRVLATGLWPLQAAVPKCNIPKAPRNAFEAFRRFYLAKHSGRLLTLHPQLGSVDLNAVFFGPLKDKDSKKGSGVVSTPALPREHIIQVSTYQMCVLMLFNSKDRLTYEEISNKTDIPEQDLVRSLQSLVLDKANRRILIKTPNTKKIEPAHHFAVNDSFSSRLARVKIQAVAAKVQSEPERKETQNMIYKDRKYQIEGTIVRIMKHRNHMTHTSLVTEVTLQLKGRFVAERQVIDERINALIEREYLARKEDGKSYTYVA